MAIRSGRLLKAMAVTVKSSSRLLARMLLLIREWSNRGRSCLRGPTLRSPDANRRAAVFRELYSFASPVRAGELQTLGGPDSRRQRTNGRVCFVCQPLQDLAQSLSLDGDSNRGLT